MGDSNRGARRTLPSRRAYAGTLLTSLSIQAITVLSGAITARTLGPEGRGLLAGAQVWPSILGTIGLLGINNALAMQAGRGGGSLRRLDRKAWRYGLPSSAMAVIAGWALMPMLLGAEHAELIRLGRLNLLYIPLYVMVTHLLAIDHGIGNLRRYNIARSILAPVNLSLVILCACLGLRQVQWFIAAQLVANAAILIYRCTGRRPIERSGPSAPEREGALRAAAPFWLTSLILVGRDNAERLLLLALLDVGNLGLYVVALTASGVYISFSKSMHILAFSRSASLAPFEALVDAARLFRLMAVANCVMAVALMAAMPILLRLVYGAEFAPAVVPACVLIVAQGLLAQGAVLDEALRGQGRPLFGLWSSLASSAAFVILGMVLARPIGLPGVALAAVVGSGLYCAMMIAFAKRACPAIRLRPSSGDAKQLLALLGRLRVRTATR